MNENILWAIAFISLPLGFLLYGIGYSLIKLTLLKATTVTGRKTDRHYYFKGDKNHIRVKEGYSCGQPTTKLQIKIPILKIPFWFTILTSTGGYIFEDEINKFTNRGLYYCSDFELRRGDIIDMLYLILYNKQK